MMRIVILMMIPMKIKKIFHNPRFWENGSVIYEQKQEISDFLKKRM